jgi:hypothetical protein
MPVTFQIRSRKATIRTEHERSRGRRLFQPIAVSLALGPQQGIHTFCLIGAKQAAGRQQLPAGPAPVVAARINNRVAGRTTSLASLGSNPDE